MANKLYDEATLTGIADAIRSKSDSISNFRVKDMAEAVNNISNNSFDKFLDGTIEEIRGLEMKQLNSTLLGRNLSKVRIIEAKFESIGDSAFYNCPNLTDFYIMENDIIPELNSIDAFYGTAIYYTDTSGKGHIHVPSSMIDALKNKTYWRDYASKMIAY